MKLLFKTILLFCLPIFLLIGTYIWTDPFKVIHKYDVYLSDYIMLNRGFVSTEMFLKNKHKYKYDSFIFGSSRSCAYTSREWSKYLPSGSSAFSYSSWHESFEGMYKKVLFIDSVGSSIKNAILVIDTDYTFKKGTNTFERDHYLITGRSKGEFHMMCFSQFLREYWLIPASVDYKLFHKQRPYMKKFFKMQPSDLDTINNDWFPDSEMAILKDSAGYYSGSLNKFYQRPEKERVLAVQLNDGDKMMLQKTSDIFRKQGTEVKIIIGPLYDQKRFNSEDMAILESYFGKGNVFDFSGINDLTEKTASYANDVTHYRKRTGNIILHAIYK